MSGSFTRWGKGRFIVPLLLGALLIPVLAGCGGSGGKATSGTTARRGVVRVALDWANTTKANTTKKTASRALTPAANSVVIAVMDSQGFTDSRTVNRPAAGANQNILIEFFALNEGKAQLTAQAFTGRNGLGDAVAQSAAQYDLPHDQTPEKEISFEAIYTRILLSPDPVTLNQGATLTFIAQGVLNNGTVTQPNPTGTWTSSNTTAATVDSSGKVTGREAGTATISFTDNFGRVGTAALTVRGGDAEVNIQ